MSQAKDGKLIATKSSYTGIPALLLDKNHSTTDKFCPTLRITKRMAMKNVPNTTTAMVGSGALCSTSFPSITFSTNIITDMYNRQHTIGIGVDNSTVMADIQTPGRPRQAPTHMLGRRPNTPLLLYMPFVYLVRSSDF